MSSLLNAYPAPTRWWYVDDHPRVMITLVNGTTSVSAKLGQGVWFVYDGDCPVCSMAASALRVRQEHGPLHLVDARKDVSNPLLHEVKRRNFDLDEGMVIWCNEKFYHGRDALVFMARYGDQGWFNHINRALFRSEGIAGHAYPWMRAFRNLLLKVRGVSKLSNLRKDAAPFFKPVFGDDWSKLPAVMQRRFANRPFNDDVVAVEGTLDIESSVLGRVLKLIFLLTGTRLPDVGKNIPVSIYFVTDAHSNDFRLERTLRFPGREPHQFQSTMVPHRDNELIEFIGPVFGWYFTAAWDGSKVVLRHRGYRLNVYGFHIPVPLTMILGVGYAEEVPRDRETFAMMTEIRHPLWGKVFGYSGTFRITKDL